MNKVLIIAEAGVNHNGCLDRAKKMIDVAAEAGVDIIKFQAFKTELLVTKQASKATYQKDTTDAEESQFEMLKRLELDFQSNVMLQNYCKEKNIEFLSSPFDMESIDDLIKLGIELFKIPSGEIINYPYLKKIAEQNKRVIISTGMANMSEVSEALKVLVDNGTAKENITVLHCNTEYPTPMKDVNLLAMNTIKNELGVNIGYSDHTEGVEIPTAAVALGAKVIEKHFTLDKSLPGPDHKASLNPEELKAMVSAIRNIEAALGSGVKEPSPSETKNKTAVRKSIVAKRKILKGETLSDENLTIKRPGNGVSPMKWESVIGVSAKRDFEIDELIEL